MRLFMVSDPTLFRVPETPDAFLYFAIPGSTWTAPVSFVAFRAVVSFSSGGVAARSPHAMHPRTIFVVDTDFLREACTRPPFLQAWTIPCSPVGLPRRNPRYGSRPERCNAMRCGHWMCIAPRHEAFVKLRRILASAARVSRRRPDSPPEYPAPRAPPRPPS